MSRSVRIIGAAAVPALLSLACFQPPPPRVARVPPIAARAEAPAETPAPPPQVCRDVPQYEDRVVPLEGEWTQPACTDCDEIRVCHAAGPEAPAECVRMTQDAYTAARTVQVQTGTRRVCDEVAPTHDRPAPIAASATGTCPGGVTTSGRC